MAGTTTIERRGDYAKVIRGLLDNVYNRENPPPAPPGQGTDFSRSEGKAVVHHRATVTTVEPQEDGSLVVELLFSTGTDVLRFDYGEWEYFQERLTISEAAIDTTRLDGGVPILDSHQSYSADNVIGRSMAGSFRIDGGNAYVKARFTQAQVNADTVLKVREGTLVDCSVGYIVLEWTITETQNELSVWTADRWQPMEISMVPIPADPGAGVRSSASEFNKRVHEARKAPAPAARQEETTSMSEVVPPAAAPTVDVAAERAAGAKAERLRTAGIVRFAKVQGLEESDPFVREHLEAGTELADFYRLAVDELEKRQSEDTPVIGRTLPSTGNRTVNEISPAQQARDMGDAFVHQLTGRALANERSRRYIDEADGDGEGFDVSALVRASYRSAHPNSRLGYRHMVDQMVGQGVRSPLPSRVRAAQGLVTPSDFGGLTSLIVGLVTANAYADFAASVDYQSFTRERVVSDFKQVRMGNYGAFSHLEKVTTNGRLVELRTGTSIARGGVEDFGGKFSVDRKFLYDNDSGFFTDLGRNLAASARHDEQYKAIEALQDGILIQEDPTNPNTLVTTTLWDDPNVLPYEDGGNVVQAANLYQAMPFIRMSLRNQLFPGSTRRANYRLAVLVVSADLEEQAAQLQRAVNNQVLGGANTNLDVNGRPLYTYIVMPELPEGTAYGFADPNMVGTLISYRLTGYAQADVFQIPHPEQLGLAWGVLDPMGFGFAQKPGVVKVDITG